MADMPGLSTKLLPILHVADPDWSYRVLEVRSLNGMEYWWKSSRQVECRGRAGRYAGSAIEASSSALA